jgi:Undecaprenyl-phosphate glucose phosphotransferase
MRFVPSMTIGNAQTFTGTMGRAPVVPADRLISQSSLIAILLLFDVIANVAVGLVTFACWKASADYDYCVLIPALVMIGCEVPACLAARWAYTVPALSSSQRQVMETAVALGLSLASYIVCGALLGTYAPEQRSWLLFWFLGAWAILAAARLILARALARWSADGRLARRAVVVGGGESAHELLQTLERTPNAAVQILGTFDDRDKTRSPEQLGPYNKLGRVEDLARFCREQRVQLLIIALPLSAEDRILHILKRVWVLPIDIRIAVRGSKLQLCSRSYSYIGDVPFLPIFDKPMSDWSMALKEVHDRLLAGLALVVFSPLFAAIATAIKLDSRGPVLFKQIRYGFNNEKIEVYKFRSMCVEKMDADGAESVTRDDMRVTRIGRILRRSSLDELPQLFNVAVKGDLALVGPRPHALQSKACAHLFEEVVDGYFARHRVKPGVTGWAQINGWRGGIESVEQIEQRVAHDLYYIENWSILLDLRILLRTPLALITAENAY